MGGTISGLNGRLAGKVVTCVTDAVDHDIWEPQGSGCHVQYGLASLGSAPAGLSVRSLHQSLTES